MTFSICIPNFNYARYLDRTIRSVLDQSHIDLEVVVCDNASTDDSVATVRRIRDPRVSLHQNRVNVGFAANLDRAAGPAKGDRVILLSSDDLLRPGALECYQVLATAIGDSAKQAVFSATADVIDPDDTLIGGLGPDPAIWRESDRVAELESAVGSPVYRVSGLELLKRSVAVMGNPFNFATTCYPKSLYDAIEGYGGNRTINPDKWFNWRLLSVAGDAYFVDKPLCGYRWHSQNQTAQQAASGALRFHIDEYAMTLDLDGQVLARLGIDRSYLVQAFIEYDIARHGLATLARGARVRAARILQFGKATYPTELRANAKARILGLLLGMGPLGGAVASAAYRRRARHLAKANPRQAAQVAFHHATPART